MANGSSRALQHAAIKQSRYSPFRLDPMALRTLRFGSWLAVCLAFLQRSQPVLRLPPVRVGAFGTFQDSCRQPPRLPRSVVCASAKMNNVEYLTTNYGEIWLQECGKLNRWAVFNLPIPGYGLGEKSECMDCMLVRLGSNAFGAGKFGWSPN